jgi:hypothetical protein
MPVRSLVFFLLCLIPPAAGAAVVYKWVDKDGVTHFSDQPYPGAQQLTVGAAQTYAAPPPSAVAPTPPAAAPAAKPYDLCEIAIPTSDQVFFSVQSVAARLRVQPDLRPGDRVVVFYDGKRMPQINAAAGQFTLSPTYRGTHSVAAIVEDARGVQQCEAAPVTFHVRQPSILAPNRVRPPRP